MLYLVQVRASMERANTIDAGDGPGPVFAKLVERFRPEAFYGNPTGRETFMVVNLDTPAQIAEAQRRASEWKSAPLQYRHPPKAQRVTQ